MHITEDDRNKINENENSGVLNINENIQKIVEQKINDTLQIRQTYTN